MFCNTILLKCFWICHESIRNIFQYNFAQHFLNLLRIYQLKHSCSNTHSWQIQNTFKIFWKIFMDQNIFWLKKFLVPNIFETKFLLNLSYDSHSIHVQNTFLTDSKQIQKILENMFGSKYFLTQNVLDPNIFGTKFLLYLSYD